MTTDRACTICPVTYPAGTYGQHRLTHPEGATRHSARRASKAARNTAITLEVALGVRTLDDIAADHHITGERVRQIAEQEGVTRNSKPQPALRRIGHVAPCRTCGQRIPVGQMRTHRLQAGHTSRPGGRVTQAHLDLIREFYERGLGYKSIGDLTGLHFMVVKWHVVHMGITPRRRGEYNRFGLVPVLRREMAARWTAVA